LPAHTGLGLAVFIVFIYLVGLRERSWAKFFSADRMADRPHSLARTIYSGVKQFTRPAAKGKAFGRRSWSCPALTLHHGFMVGTHTSSDGGVVNVLSPQPSAFGVVILVDHGRRDPGLASKKPRKKLMASCGAAAPGSTNNCGIK
jgi:hypothetical protein